jgi:DNA-binding NarL/FixJ family response regulator
MSWLLASRGVRFLWPQVVADENRALSHPEIVETNLKNISSDFMGKLAQILEELTPTKAVIVQLIVIGRSTKEIAKTLSRGTSTVDFHRNNICQKLGLRHRGKNLRQHLLEAGKKCYS